VYARSSCRAAAKSYSQKAAATARATGTVITHSRKHLLTASFGQQALSAAACARAQHHDTAPSLPSPPPPKSWLQLRSCSCCRSSHSRKATAAAKASSNLQSDTATTTTCTAVARAHSSQLQLQPQPLLQERGPVNSGWTSPEKYHHHHHHNHTSRPSPSPHHHHTTHTPPQEPFHPHPWPHRAAGESAFQPNARSLCPSTPSYANSSLTP